MCVCVCVCVCVCLSVCLSVSVSVSVNGQGPFTRVTFCYLLIVAGGGDALRVGPGAASHHPKLTQAPLEGSHAAQRANCVSRFLSIEKDQTHVSNLENGTRRTKPKKAKLHKRCSTQISPSHTHTYTHTYTHTPTHTHTHTHIHTKKELSDSLATCVAP